MGKSSIGLEGELLAKASMDGISVVGSESVAFANDELAKMLGYEEGQELVGRPWQELITPDDTSLSTNQLLTRVEGERDWCGSGVGERRDGGRVPVQMAMHAAEEGVVCVVRDVTVQRERKQKLDRYETFLDTVDDDDSVPDEALRLDTGSDRLFEMLARFGCSREEAQQRHGHDLVVNEGARAYLETGIGRAIDRESSTGSFQRSAETPHGERIVLESRFRLSPATDGPRGCIDVIRDVTARKERERELREARQFNEELVLNAPFSIVRIDE
ncbi:MAG: PAS domain S-box protein, partial [Haloferacaceae archaeon]